MEICTFDTVYSVIYKKEEDGKTQYLCRKQEDGKQYLLFSQNRKYIEKTCITFLNEQLNNQDFTDFQDLFIYKEQLIAVMRYHVAPALKERLEELTEFEERLEIGRKILEVFLVQRMPAYFQLQCLDVNRILVNNSMNVEFAYSLEDVELGAVTEQAQVWEKMADLLALVWKEELKRENVPALQKFMDSLRSGQPKTLESVYQDYMVMLEAVKAIPREERKRLNQRLLKIWNRIRALLPKLKMIAALLLLAAAVIYLCYTIADEMRPKGEKEQLIRYIGTLELKE